MREPKLSVLKDPPPAFTRGGARGGDEFKRISDTDNSDIKRSAEERCPGSEIRLDEFRCLKPHFQPIAHSYPPEGKLTLNIPAGLGMG